MDTVYADQAVILVSYLLCCMIFVDANIRGLAYLCLLHVWKETLKKMSSL